MVRLEQEGFAWGWGNCRKYLKRGWNRKEGRGHKDFKKMGGGKLGHRVGALKRRGLKTTCKLWWCFYFYYCLLPCKNRRYSVFKDFPKVPIKQSCIHLHLAVPQDLIRIRSSRPWVHLVKIFSILLSAIVCYSLLKLSIITAKTFQKVEVSVSTDFVKVPIKQIYLHLGLSVP